MSLGPLEYIVIDFPGAELRDDIVPALADLVSSQAVRILDLMVVTKDANGVAATVEYEDLPSAPGLADIDGDVTSVLSEDDAAEVAATMAPDSSALVILWEDVWARSFADAVLRASGRISDGARIPHDVAVKVFAGLQ